MIAILRNEGLGLTLCLAYCVIRRIRRPKMELPVNHKKRRTNGRRLFENKWRREGD